jgi:tetratricopeptide (TPR) repeat protein
MNKRIELESFFDSKKSHAEYIEKYEENREFFTELLAEGKKEDIEHIISITIYKYSDSLIQKGFYKKALKTLENIEKDLEKLNGTSKIYDLYFEGLTFSKGVSLGWLKRHKESKSEFEKLLKRNPDNDLYINWYKTNRKEIISQFFNRFMYMGLIIAALELLLKLFNIEFKLGYIGFPIAIGAILISWIWKMQIDKSELNINK